MTSQHPWKIHPIGPFAEPEWGTKSRGWLFRLNRRNLGRRYGGDIEGDIKTVAQIADWLTGAA